VQSWGRVNRWVGIEEVGRRLGLERGPAIVLADDCALAGWVRHDRSHLPDSTRGAVLPARVSLSGEGWGLIRTKARPADWRKRQSLKPRFGLAGAQENLSLALAAAARLADKAQVAELGHVALAVAEPLGRYQGLAAAAPAFHTERMHAAHVEAV
jgi:hypothetical protein